MTRNLIPHRRLVAIALAAALVVGACGTDSDPVSGSGRLLAPTPIKVAGDSGDSVRDVAAQAAEAASGDERMGLMVPWVVYEFILGDMPELPSQGNGWTYPAGADIDVDRIREIATALGLQGTPASRAEENGGGWIIGPDDGSAPALWVSADGQLSWWFNASYRTGEVVVECVEPAVDPEDATSTGGGTDAEPGTEVRPECEYQEPQPPAGILTQDQARARALDLLTRMGADPTRFDLQVHADQWYASVWAQEILGGTNAPTGWYFGFGENGRLDYAGGQLATPQEVGPYPLIDLDTALQRLRTGSFGYGSLAADTVAADAPADPCGENGDCTQPEPVTVTLTGYRMDLWWAWDTDGTIWLLPAFTFLGSDGQEFTVPAVTDEYLIMSDAVAEPGTDEPAPVGSGEAISNEDAQALVGMTEDEALEAVAERGWAARIVERDGEGFAVTDDYRIDRVNLTITDGAVTAVAVG